MELEAESVAVVVCDALGIDAGAWTFGASWPERRRRRSDRHDQDRLVGGFGGRPTRSCRHWVRRSQVGSTG
jgi:hypothetical protein